MELASIEVIEVGAVARRFAGVCAAVPLQGVSPWGLFFVDDQVGRLLQFMRQQGLLRNTIIVFTSDHGEMLGDHHLYRKCWPYEASARVPFLIWAAPELGWQEGLEVASPVGWQDIMPTLLDAAGALIPPACTARSLLPILQGGVKAVRDILHGEQPGNTTTRTGIIFGGRTL